MGTLLQSTLNTRALPTGNLHYIRSDYPGKLTDQEVKWLLQNDITTVVDLREEKEYIAKPCRLEDEEGFVYYHLPVTGGGDTPNSPDAVAETYLAISWLRRSANAGYDAAYDMLPDLEEE